MPHPDITPGQLWDAFQNVPAGRRAEALHAIEVLQELPESVQEPDVKTGADLRDSELIGIWADRTDINDNHEFARELRQRAEQRG